MSADRWVSALVVAMLAINMGLGLFMAAMSLVALVNGRLDWQLGVPLIVGLVLYRACDATLRGVAPMVRRFWQ